MSYSNIRFRKEILSYTADISTLSGSLQKWLSKFKKENFLLAIDNITNVTFIALICSRMVPITIDIGHTPCYPFKSPKVKIREFGYNSLLKINQVSSKILNIKCLCCESVICDNNWNIQCNIYDILNEVKKNLEIKLRAVEVLHCIKIIDKYMGDGFMCLPILEFL